MVMLHWKPIIVMVPTLSSQVAPEVAVMTTSGVASGDKIGILFRVSVFYAFVLMAGRCLQQRIGNRQCANLKTDCPRNMVDIYHSLTVVTCSTEEVNTSLAEPPLKLNVGLLNLIYFRYKIARKAVVSRVVILVSKPAHGYRSNLFVCFQEIYVWLLNSNCME